MFTRDFVKDAAERAAKAFCWSLLSFFGAVGWFDAFHASWVDALGVAVGAAVLSVLGSVASYNAGNRGTASMTKAVVTTSYAEAVAHGRHAADLRDGPR